MKLKSTAFYLAAFLLSAFQAAAPAQTACGGEGRRCPEALLALEERAVNDSSADLMRCRLTLLLGCGSKSELRAFAPLFANRFSGDSASVILAARGLSAIKDWKGAIRLLERWFAGTGEIEFIKAMAQVYRDNKQQELAESMAEKMLRMDSTRADGWWLKGDLVFSRTLLQKFKERMTRNERLREALRYYQKAAQLDSTSAAYQAGIGEVYGQLNQWDSALIAYEKAVVAAPGDFTLLKKFGAVLLVRKKVERALEVFEMAFQQDPMDLDLLQSIEEGHRLLGTSAEYYLTGQERLADALPDTLSIRYNLGLEYLHREMAEPAERAFRKVLERNGAFSETNRALAGLLLSQGRFADALPFLEKQASLPGSNERDLMNLASAALRVGDTVRAVKAWDAVLRVNPSNARAAFSAATRYFNQRLFDDVLRILKDGLAYDDPAGAARMAGVALFELKQDPVRALRLLRSCAGTAEDDERLWYMIATLCERISDAPSAIKAWNACLSGYPDSPNAGYYRDRIKLLEKRR